MYASESRYRSRGQRLKIWLIGFLGYMFINITGHTIRWRSIGDNNLEDIHKSGNRAIFAFWHGRIIPATYYFRKRGIVVMTSMNTDGEAIAQCIERFGYGTARGSSSRGGLRALAAMKRAIQSGRDAGFSVDGPRGPRYIAKQGPVLLARRTGAPIFCFHISLKRKIRLKTWDEFHIPLPFTDAIVLQGEPIWVPPDASQDELRALHGQVQQALDDLRERGDSWW